MTVIGRAHTKQVRARRLGLTANRVLLGSRRRSATLPSGRRFALPLSRAPSQAFSAIVVPSGIPSPGTDDRKQAKAIAGWAMAVLDA